MTTGRMQTILPELKKLVSRQDNQTADRELLRRFSAEQDETAFAEIVRRHGPMLLGVCQRVLHNGHDAVDIRPLSMAGRFLLAKKVYPFPLALGSSMRMHGDAEGVRHG